MEALRGFLRSTYFRLLPLFCLLVLIIAVPLRLLRRPFRGQRNSWWAGTPILILPINARAERLLGVNAASLVYHAYGIAEQDFDINLSAFSSNRLLGWLIPLLTFLYAAVTRDRLHFFCDQALLPSDKGLINKHELIVYKHLGIEIFFWVYGADVRTRTRTLELGEPNCCTFCPKIGSFCICDEQRGRSNYETIRRYATAVFSMGDMIHYTPGSRNDLFFWPIDLSSQDEVRYSPLYPEVGANETITIVHASNHQHFKGTRFLIEAVEELKKEGWNIELRLIEGVPNEQAIEHYRKADIIFDQCLIGFYGYFALEGMALGKPVMSFIRKPGEYLCNYEECPIIGIQCATLRDDIRNMLENRDKLNEVGRRSRCYIEKFFTVEAFARRLEQAYRDLGIRN